MVIKRIAGKIYGAELTNAEATALKIEARRIIAQETREHYSDIDATFIWVLRQVTGFGEKRLKEIYMAYAPKLEELCKHYEMEDDDAEAWLCKRKLLDDGIDTSAWAEEVRKAHPEWK